MNLYFVPSSRVPTPAPIAVRGGVSSRIRVVRLGILITRQRGSLVVRIPKWLGNQSNVFLLRIGWRCGEEVNELWWSRGSWRLPLRGGTSVRHGVAIATPDYSPIFFLYALHRQRIRRKWETQLCFTFFSPLRNTIAALLISHKQITTSSNKQVASLYSPLLTTNKQTQSMNLSTTLSSILFSLPLLLQI
jgi:hypothetical protein